MRKGGLKTIRSTWVVYLSVVFCLLFYASIATAALWQFNATTVFAPNQSSFDVQFNDADGNGVVSIADIVDGSFSGVTIPGTGNTIFYDQINQIPDWSGNGLQLLTSPDNRPTRWEFEKKVGQAFTDVDDRGWTYEANIVPLPNAAWLLGSGLLGLVYFKRKTRF